MTHAEGTEDAHLVLELLQVMSRLRDPRDGCPWDVAQDFNSIAPYTIEEAYEVADAIARDDMADLCDELGDLLLQVVFHARMAEERRAFRFADVVRAIVSKMQRRHPHVFGDVELSDADGVRRAWEEIKAEERGDTGDDPLADVPPGLPALQRAAKLQRRAARTGFDWPAAEPVLGKLHEEVAELEREVTSGAGRDRLRAELGDVLFTAVNLARHLDVDPEGALVEASSRFERRFRAMCAAVGGGRALADRSPEQLELLWEAAKDAESSAPPG